MRLALIDAYKNRDNLNVKAPAIDPIRNLVDKLRKAAAVAKEKLEGAVGSVTDGADELAAKAKEAASGVGGFMGGALNMAAKVGEAATNVAGSVADAAASGTGAVAAKALELLADALDACLKAIDEPFQNVGKDIFRIKETEIIECYCKIIDKKVQIKDAVVCVRGADPWGEAEYKACKPTSCVDTMQSVCEKEIREDLRAVVQPEIDKHTVTKVWDVLMDKYNECNAELKKYDFLKDYVGEPFKLDLNEHIVNEVTTQFHGFMQEKEKAIRADPKSVIGRSKMPVVFPRLFSGTPKYNEFTMEDYANMERKDTC